MSIDLYPKEALLTVVRTARKPIAFLVGAPLSTDSGGGVPGVVPMLDLVREEIRARVSSELPRFEDAIRGKSSGDAYQAAMKWLQGNLTQDAVNRVVRAAVLLARRVGAAADFDCDGAACDWHLPAGSQQLAVLVCRDRERFPGPILTTNFDPLLSLAIESCGGRPNLRVIQSDGGLGQDVKRAGEIEVVHLHGFWRDSDTLHTPVQLTAARPRLKDSLKEILRQRTLIVAAYGGWDDVFARALAEVAFDEAAQVNVLWCFRETDADKVEQNNRRLLERVQPAVTRGRFMAYGGIDCHTIFGEMEAALPAASSAAPVSAGVSYSPIAGWQLITPAFLSALPPLMPEEIVRYFDGAVPTWRHAISDAIPRRQAVVELGTRLTKALSAKATCTLQIIRAAGGEGKSTLLLQAAADAAHAGGWAILWRTSPTEGLPPEHIAKLDPSQQWLIVADDADNLVPDLAETAQRLNDEGRTNVHFLLAARDVDWKNSKGDHQPWAKWLTSQPPIVLRGITPKDAKAVVLAWEDCGPNALRQLATQGSTSSRVAALQDAIRDAENEQWEQNRRRKVVDGSFFGGLLAVRFGQDGLQAHVRDFLNQLRGIPIEGGNGNLFDALLYIAACHGAGIPGINEKVLADLVGVPRDWVQSHVVRPLGEEAAAVYNAGHALTRHSKVAAAILLEAEQTFDADLSEVWTRLIHQTTQTGREPGMRVGPTFSPIVHAGPRLQMALPPHLTEDRRKAIAIAAAKAAKKYQSEWLGCVDSLARTYRNAGDVEEAVRLFRASLSEARLKVDYDKVIRAYWYEWSVCEGERRKGREHALADVWVGGLSLSDHLAPAPITSKDGKLTCAGLGVAFGKLAQPGPNCPYARARRAAAHLGRLTSNDPKAASYFDRYDREANKLKTPHPKDVAEAIAWLTAGVAQASHELRDPFLAGLAKLSDVSFTRFRNNLSSR